MQKLISIFFISLLNLMANMSIAATPLPPLPADWGNHTTQYAIIPIYQNFTKKMQAFEQQSAQFCTNPTDIALFTATQQAFHDALTAWMRTQAVRFGVVKTESLDSRIVFFPDRKETVKQKVTGLLNSKEPLTVEMIKKQGNIALSLSALEILLFEPAEKTLDSFTDKNRCIYLQAATTYLSELAAQIAINVEKAEKPDIATVVASLIELIEIMQNNKLAMPMGKKNKGIINPFFAENWRSQASVRNLQANLYGLQQLYMAGTGYGIDDYLLAIQEIELHKQIAEQIKTTQEILQTFPTTLTAALTTGSAERAQLEKVFFEINILNDLFKIKLSKALNINTGFNSLDGD